MVAIAVLSVIALLLTAYLLFIRLQLRSINRQLKKHLAEQTRQPISLGLLDHELNKLAININKCLNAEENLRIETIHEEIQFKEMIANISHDLRTPLTAIKGYQQLLEKEPLTDNQKHKLQIAQNHANELGDLIEYFFEYSYILNTKEQFKPERFNLTNLTAECLADSVELFEEKIMAVQFDEGQPAYAYADKGMTIRIINNLIRNSLQYAVGDVNVKILKTHNAIISFSNYVNNSNEIDVNCLFERFYTEDKSRGSSKGLGLSIVKLLAEQMGGSAVASLQNGLLEIQVKLLLF